MIGKKRSRYAPLAGFAAVALAVLVLTEGQAQQPASGDLKTVRGTVNAMTTAPKGEVDGARLDDGTWVHWPPHLAARFSEIVKSGDRIQATGWFLADPKGDYKLEVSTVTNLTTNATRANDAQEPPAPKDKGKKDKKGKGAKGKAAPIVGDIQTVRGTVKSFTSAPKGEVDGLILSDGTWVHWPPHLQNQFKNAAIKGDEVRVIGQKETGPKGDTKLEVSTLTNLATSVTVTNPERPAPVPALVSTSRGNNIDSRVQALEDRIDQLIRAMELLQKKK
jgi:hypothetical protein